MTSYPQHLLVHQMVAAQAFETPDAPAIIEGEDVLNYKELNRRANQLAHHLRALGVGPEVPVALCMERSIALIVSALGILKAGGAYLPVDPSSNPPERLNLLFQDSKAQVVVTLGKTAKRLAPGKRRLVALDDDWQDISCQATFAPEQSVRPENSAYIIYTSGSSGQPKGVEIRHESLLNLVFWHRRAFQVTCADQATQLANPGFDAAVWELWPYLCAGASIQLPDDSTRISPEKLRDWLVSRKITISFAPTPMAERLIELDWPPETPLRLLLTGGDMLRRRPSSKLPFSLINNYGPTECTVVATSSVVATENGDGGLPSIGKAIDNVETYVLDEELRRVPDGTPGELYIGGNGLARGYLNRPELTAERFIPNPFVQGGRFYKTGDRVRVLQDGQLSFLGRIDDQVKIRGYRIEPEEIGAILRRHSLIKECLVIAFRDTMGEQQLAAYVVSAGEAEPKPEILREYLRRFLPDYMIPSVFIRLGQFPVTANGKIDRSALPSPAIARTMRQKSAPEAHSPLQRELLGIVAGLMRLSDVQLDDNFFTLGGHSLLGTQLIARIRNAFGVEVSLRGLFDNPTIMGISLEIERLIRSKESSASETGTGGAVILGTE